MKFISEIFQGINGTYSSKRTITFIAFFLIGIAFISNLFWKFDISDTIFDGVLYIVLFGIGATTAEPMANAKLLNRNLKNDESDK